MTDDAPSAEVDPRVLRSIDTKLASAFPRAAEHRDMARAKYEFYPELLTPAGHPKKAAISAESTAVASYFTDLVRAGLDGEWRAGSFMDPELGQQYDASVGTTAMIGWSDVMQSHDVAARGHMLERFHSAVESAVERMPWILSTFRGVEDGANVGGRRLDATMKRIGSEFQPGPILAYAAGVAGFPSTVVPPFHQAEIVPGQVIGAAVRAAPSREVYNGSASAEQPVADWRLSAEEAEYIGVAAAVAEPVVMAPLRLTAARARKAVSPAVVSTAGSPDGTPQTDREAELPAVVRSPAQQDGVTRKR